MRHRRPTCPRRERAQALADSPTIFARFETPSDALGAPTRLTEHPNIRDMSRRVRHTDATDPDRGKGRSAT